MLKGSVANRLLKVKARRVQSSRVALAVVSWWVVEERKKGRGAMRCGCRADPGTTRRRRPTRPPTPPPLFLTCGLGLLTRDSSVLPLHTSINLQLYPVSIASKVDNNVRSVLVSHDLVWASHYSYAFRAECIYLFTSQTLPSGNDRTTYSHTSSYCRLCCWFSVSVIS